jgi:hypothetical protein
MAHDTLLHDDRYPGCEAQVTLSAFLDDLFMARLPCKQLLRGRLLESVTNLSVSPSSRTSCQPFFFISANSALDALAAGRIVVSFT